MLSETRIDLDGIIAIQAVTIEELEDTILEFQDANNNMTPRIIQKVARKSGGVKWPNWLMAMFFEMIACAHRQLVCRLSL